MGEHLRKAEPVDITYLRLVRTATDLNPSDEEWERVREAVRRWGNKGGDTPDEALGKCRYGFLSLVADIVLAEIEVDIIKKLVRDTHAQGAA